MGNIKSKLQSRKRRKRMANERQIVVTDVRNGSSLNNGIVGHHEPLNSLPHANSTIVPFFEPKRMQAHDNSHGVFDEPSQDRFKTNAPTEDQSHDIMSDDYMIRSDDGRKTSLIKSEEPSDNILSVMYAKAGKVDNHTKPVVHGESDVMNTMLASKARKVKTALPVKSSTGNTTIDTNVKKVEKTNDKTPKIDDSSAKPVFGLGRTLFRDDPALEEEDD